MPKRRDQIRMSGDEAWAFIASRKNLQVATLGRDGAPHLTTLWFAVVDGAIVFETFSKSQKVQNLRRDPRIAVLVEAGTEYAELRGVSISGRATLHDDPARVARYARAIVSRNHPELSGQALEAAVHRMTSKRTAVVVQPERMASWDHRKLHGID